MKKINISKKEQERLQNIDPVLLTQFPNHPTFYKHVISECSDDEFNSKYKNIIGRWTYEKLNIAKILMHSFYIEYYKNNFYKKVNITLEKYSSYIDEEMKKYGVYNIQEIMIKSHVPFIILFDKSFNELEFYIEEDKEVPEDIVKALGLDSIKEKMIPYSNTIYLKSRFFKTIYVIPKELLTVT